jgi:uncharacterized protein
MVCEYGMKPASGREVIAMGIELRPLGVACNLACHYCYQNPQREAGNQRMTYDLEKMKAEALRVGGPFTLFGGEPLLMRFEDLENLFAWGLETSGGSSIQTNGLLIEDRHIDLFRRCKVSVGISIDGPGELNDARWARGLERTRQSTALVESAIERLCREYEPPGLIVTLHKGNATADKLPIMAEWMRSLHKLGIRSLRLHLLEVDHTSVRETLALSARENVQALLAFAELQDSLPGMYFDLFDEMEALLEGRDQKVGCTWRACDPYTTEAVQGIEGNGQSSNCGRTNKEGVGFIKAKTTGYERYLALYRTPQAENGCQGCRFFLMCKGQCPGTSINGDWRNRTEHCEEWKELFATIERRMILAGKVPLTIQPLRFDLEARHLQAWERGENPSISRTLADWHTEQTNASDSANEAKESHAAIHAQPRVRISWVSEYARQKWEERLQKLPEMIEEMTVHAASVLGQGCAVRLVPKASFPRLQKLAEAQGLSTAVLPAEALPRGICTRSAETSTAVFLAGAEVSVAQAKAAWESDNWEAFRAQVALPACCLDHAREIATGSIGASDAAVDLPATISAHSLLAPLGISALPIEPCRVNCPSALEAAVRWLELAAARGYASESGWLRECFSWAMSWSELHGVTEVKTPIFRMCFQTASRSAPRLIRRIGTAAEVDGGAIGLSFPYLPLARQPRLVEIGVAQ